MGVWIEIKQVGRNVGDITVTPCMGVWIEIKICFKSSSLVLVTPCMGVWIEIILFMGMCIDSQVTPCMGVWIEILWLVVLLSTIYRHSLYGSVDWNTFKSFGSSDMILSLPVWECGLKLELTIKIFWKKQVTPCMGVWIEIELDGSSGIKYASLPVWECGLKYMEHFSLTKNLCHSLYGSVDWNGHWQ